MVRARVGKTDPAGKHGPYAIAVSDQMEGTISFSLDPPVWNESIMPTEKMEVILSDIIKAAGGWRAMSARFVRPTDSKSEIQKSRHGDTRCQRTA